jgi:hypothetical protein
MKLRKPLTFSLSMVGIVYIIDAAQAKFTNYVFVPDSGGIKVYAQAPALDAITVIH